MLTSPARLCRPCRRAGPAHPAATASFSIPQGEIPRETDCLLEEAGFEPLVPRRRPVSSCCRSRSRRLFAGADATDIIRSRKLASRGDRSFKSGFRQRRSVANLAGNPASGPSLLRDYVWRGSASYATRKAAGSSPVDPLLCRQWKLLKINVNESMLSPSLPRSLHARRSPSAADRLDRESKWQSFRFVTAYAATQY